MKRVEVVNPNLEASNRVDRVDKPGATKTAERSVPMVVSFDVEEHDRIEAAAGLTIDPELSVTYRDRMKQATEWLLELLAARQIPATFFVVGRIAETNAVLVRSIHEAGHEVASHGWDHRRIHKMNPKGFREDVRISKDALEQASGAAVVGFRAPTFSVVRQTAWALDILAELGMLYDSSIYPVHHDRYGVPEAPRGPFLAVGAEREILEIPPATLKLPGMNLPVGGGGYFRLLPCTLLRLALWLARRNPECRATMLYFHPWEFDPGQPRLPLNGLNRFRTYVGISRSRQRLSLLLGSRPYFRAVDLARQLSTSRDCLPRFQLAS
jgi:polysaccharide deacetylase family protein (PEP-CTERM system associated)